MENVKVIRTTPFSPKARQRIYRMTKDQFERMEQGEEHIQTIFPTMSPGQIEFIISGMTEAECESMKDPQESSSLERFDFDEQTKNARDWHDLAELVPTLSKVFKDKDSNYSFARVGQRLGKMMYKDSLIDVYFLVSGSDTITLIAVEEEYIVESKKDVYLHEFFQELYEFEIYNRISIIDND